MNGDDFVIEGRESDLHWAGAILEKKYIVKIRAILGPERGDAKVAEILSRTVEWREDEIWYEADPRHVEKMLEDMDMEECNPCVIPGAKGQNEEDDEEELDGMLAWRYRSVVARANYLAQDRPDIRLSVKEPCREMSSPRKKGWRALKNLCR